MAGGSYDSFGDRVYMKAYRHKLGERGPTTTFLLRSVDLGVLPRYPP